MEGLWCGKLCCDSLDRKFEKKKETFGECAEFIRVSGVERCVTNGLMSFARFIMANNLEEESVTGI